MSRRILIIGNLGYIGPIVAQHFRRSYDNIKIIGVDTGFFAACAAHPLWPTHTELDWQIYADIRNLDASVFRDVDTVVHLAALSNDPLGKSYERVTEDINQRCTLRLAEKAKAAGVSNYVFASSCSVYGAGGNNAKAEEAPLEPQTAYARSKIGSEQILARLASTDFVVTCLRFATACGFSPLLRLDLVLNDFVASALSQGKIEILSNGKPWRPLIHVQDMARAIDWATNRSCNNGGDFLTVNTGMDVNNITIHELAILVSTAIDNVDVAIRDTAPNDKRSYKVDFSAFAKMAPQYQPQMTLPDCVADLIEGLRTIDFDDSNFRNGPFIRLNHLNNMVQRGILTKNLYWTSA